MIRALIEKEWKPLLWFLGIAIVIIQAIALLIVFWMKVDFDSPEWATFFNSYIPITWLRVVTVVSVVFILDWVTKGNNTIRMIMNDKYTATAFLVGLSWAVAYSTINQTVDTTTIGDRIMEIVILGIVAAVVFYIVNKSRATANREIDELRNKLAQKENEKSGGPPT